MIKVPDYWLSFLRDNELTGKTCEIPDEHDISELGADFQLFSELEIVDETDNCYPGIAVSSMGYIAVASCLTGSGDPYFINTNDGEGGKLYRIYHDDNSVDIVAEKYQEILGFIESEN
ncbi:hypothetical protein [Vibrio sp. SCSIO 43136]|uniref:hypothetical protein n=1 Tax=Vibrio sp. SCSIO 43136 TaxID=2819101 RepID=UPI002075FD40|nr:hypothetical protein [Vibrio sp. SCSIO 43136]